jgi:hypothetical protein
VAVPRHRVWRRLRALAGQGAGSQVTCTPVHDRAPVRGRALDRTRAQLPLDSELEVLIQLCCYYTYVQPS